MVKIADGLRNMAKEAKVTLVLVANPLGEFGCASITKKYILPFLSEMIYGGILQTSVSHIDFHVEVERLVRLGCKLGEKLQDELATNIVANIKDELAMAVMQDALLREIRFLERAHHGGGMNYLFIEGFPTNKKQAIFLDGLKRPKIGICLSPKKQAFVSANSWSGQKAWNTWQTSTLPMFQAVKSRYPERFEVINTEHLLKVQVKSYLRRLGIGKDAFRRICNRLEHPQTIIERGICGTQVQPVQGDDAHCPSVVGPETQDWRRPVWRNQTIPDVMMPGMRHGLVVSHRSMTAVRR